MPKATTQVFNGFWNGFQDVNGQGPTSLAETPCYVDTVTLAFAGTAPESGFTTDYLCRYYDPATIIGWAKQLQDAGQRVLMSIIDNQTTHWNQVDIPTFVCNACEVIIGDWGLDGVDIDGESGGSSAEIFSALISEFRSQLGPRGGGKLLTFDTYLFSQEDQDLLNACKGDLDWVNLMAYFLEEQWMISRFEQYAGIMTPERVTIGVKPGNGEGDQSTPLDEVAALSAYDPATGQKAGMMLYALTRDIPLFTGHPQWTWTETIHKNLPASGDV